MFPKVHIALTTDKMDESIEFYSVFFDSVPVKRYPGYAKFDLEHLNFTLNEGKKTDLGALDHLGIQVETCEDARAAANRLADAGLAGEWLSKTECCYALQDKVWVTDPNGYSWEIFALRVADTGRAHGVEGCCG